MTSAPALAPELARGPAYPEGWFQVGYSDDLAPGQIQRLHYFGRELVLFRTEAGVAQVLNAYCAHVGAHLAVGGTVVGERIRCPFHAWEYGTDGRCKAIPYSPQIPQGAAVPAWPTEERSGIIFMWRSPVGNAPFWEPPAFDEYGDAAWTGYHRYSWKIHTTIQEVCENAVDAAHIPVIHNTNGASIPPVDYSFNRNFFDFHFKFDESHGIKHFGTYYGLGLSISRSVGRGSHCFLTGRTPIDENTLEVRYSMLSVVKEAGDPNGEVARSAAHHVTVEFEKDLPIWENKTYLPEPLLCKGDGPIGRFRMWARQFHPDTETAWNATEATGKVEFGAKAERQPA
jgi:3-ketosteroid 9alpha-monooxygenase subunit A